MIEKEKALYESGPEDQGLFDCGEGTGKYDSQNHSPDPASDSTKDQMTIQQRVLATLLSEFRDMGETAARKQRWVQKVTSKKISDLTGLTPDQVSDALYRLKNDRHLIYYEFKGGRYLKVVIPEFIFEDRYINPVTGFEGEHDCI